MPATAEIAAKRIPSSPDKALVIEDRHLLAMLLGQVLARNGIDAEILRKGAEVIVRLRDEAADYALVCSDVELPEASGWTILEWVRSHRPRLRMMLISGDRDDDFLLEADRRGAVAAFRSPFKIAEVEQTLAELFPYL